MCGGRIGLAGNALLSVACASGVTVLASAKGGFRY
jgi:hypothetical protein